MDKFQDAISKELFDEIAEYIRQNCRRWTDQCWASSRADEDALTGDFCSKFRLDETFSKDESSIWSINYKKFRGRGLNAPESKFGADGIFEIEVKDTRGKVIFKKGLLFQAKMIKDVNTDRTKGQVKAMEKIESNCSIILSYDDKIFEAIKSPEYLANPKTCNKYNICTFLIEHFFTCKIGKLNMSYDLDSESIKIDDKDNLKRIPFTGGIHNIKLEVRKVR